MLGGEAMRTALPDGIPGCTTAPWTTFRRWGQGFSRLIYFLYFKIFRTWFRFFRLSDQFWKPKPEPFTFPKVFFFLPSLWNLHFLPQAFPLQPPLTPPGVRQHWGPGSALPARGRGQQRRSGWWRHLRSRGRRSAEEKQDGCRKTNDKDGWTEKGKRERERPTDRLWRMMCSWEEGEEPVVRVTVPLLDRLRGRLWLDVVWR